jgi:hypothetical protein
MSGFVVRLAGTSNDLKEFFDSATSRSQRG